MAKETGNAPSTSLVALFQENKVGDSAIGALSGRFCPHRERGCVVIEDEGALSMRTRACRRGEQNSVVGKDYQGSSEEENMTSAALYFMVRFCTASLTIRKDECL